MDGPGFVKGQGMMMREGSGVVACYLDEPHAELVNLLQQLSFLGGQVATRLQLDECQDVDDLLRRGKVHRAGTSVTGSGTSRMKRGGVRQR